MTRGIAIRLACPARGVRLDWSAVLARHRASAPQAATVVAQYWDTASMALRQRAMALALLTQDGGPVVQTLEIESPYPVTARSFASPGAASAPGFAFARAQGFEPDESLSALERDLRPVFTIRIERTLRTVAFPDGTRAALAIDRGTMQAGARAGRGRGGRRRFREIAIVLLDGDARRVCDLARELLGEQPGLQLEFASLAQRGYRLVTGSIASGGRPRRTTPQRRASGAQVAIAGLRDAVSQIAANAAGAGSGADPEYVHRMRAALRRLRVADRLAGAAGLPVFPRRLVGDIRWLSRALAAARDWGVVQTQTWPAIRNDARGTRGPDGRAPAQLREPRACATGPTTGREIARTPGRRATTRRRCESRSPPRRARTAGAAARTADHGQEAAVRRRVLCGRRCAPTGVALPATPRGPAVGAWRSQ